MAKRLILSSSLDIGRVREYLNPSVPQSYYPQVYGSCPLVRAANRYTCCNAHQIGWTILGSFSLLGRNFGGFGEEQVVLFLPIVIDILNVLCPQIKQELTGILWSREFDQGIFKQPGVNSDLMVSYNLDLWQLAVDRGYYLPQIYLILERGNSNKEISLSLLEIIGILGKNLLNLFLPIGLLSDSLIGKKFAQYLLISFPNKKYFINGFNKIFVDAESTKKPVFRGSTHLSCSQRATLREVGKTTLKSGQFEGRLKGIMDRLDDREKAQTISQYLCSDYIPTSNITISRFISVLHPAIISTYPFSVTVEPGSHFLLTGGMAKFWMFIPLCLAKQGQLGSMRHKIDRKQGQLRKTLLDLLSHVSERLYLCDSDLAAKGTEQKGPLLRLIYALISYKLPNLAIPP